jgi:hypothetical protein
MVGPRQGDKEIGKQNGLVKSTREGLEVVGFEGFQRLAGLSPDRVPPVGGSCLHHSQTVPR